MMKGWRRRDFIAAALAGGYGVAVQAQASGRTILVVGDSLSAEYGLRRGSGWVALLEQRLAREKIAARVVNASVSGDTTSGGRSRLAALLEREKPTHVVIELGGNDALRGLPLAMTEDNLATMTRAAQAAGARVLLVGMQVPPNYGAAYGEQFARLFGQVAQANAGIDAEQVRNALQNRLFHDMVFLPRRWRQPKNCHISMLDTAGNPYLYRPGQHIKKTTPYWNVFTAPFVFY